MVTYSGQPQYAEETMKSSGGGESVYFWLYPLKEIM